MGNVFLVYQYGTKVCNKLLIKTTPDYIICL